MLLSAPDLTLNSVPNTTTKTNTKFVHQVHDLRGQTHTRKKVLDLAWFHTATYGSYRTELAGLLLAASRRRTVTLLLFCRRALALTLLQEVTQNRCAAMACVSTFTPHCLTCASTCASTCARSSQSTKYSFLRDGWVTREFYSNPQYREQSSNKKKRQRPNDHEF